METSLTRLRHITAVARTSSFSLAAAEVGITQPALSRSIQAFEVQHQVRLFDRGRGGVALTPAGELVVEQARTMLAAASDLDRSLRLYGKGEAGRVAIGLGPLMGSLLLPALVTGMLATRPHLQIVAMIRQPRLLLDRLLDDSIELIFGNNWQVEDTTGIEQERIAALRLSVVARGDHPLAARPGITSAEIDAWPFAGAVEMPQPGIRTMGGLACDNFHVLRDITIGTDCIWMTSPAFVADDLAAGRLVELPVIDRPMIETEIWAIHRRGRTRSPAALAVTEDVRRLLAGITP